MRGFLFTALLMLFLNEIATQSATARNDVISSATLIESYIYSVGTDEKEGLQERLDSTVVIASRAGKYTPVTYTMVGKDALRGSNPLNSLPMTLNLQTSVVSVNEGGTGLGASKMTIRGSKGTQINVTLNGITLNDAESQEVFWVNIPAFANVLSSVQLQRGLGTSANGAGAFGASVNMSTASSGSHPYASFDVSAGSYSTFTGTIAAGTGLTRLGIYFDAAYSRGYTDGYIRNAKAKVQSAYAALGWTRGNNSLKLTYLMGDQHTGITWNGIDLETYASNRRYNSAGEYHDALGNVRYYDNDTDNYTQHHLQLNYTRQFPRNVIWSTTFNFTKGNGYYENYKEKKKFTKYGFPQDFTFERDGVTFTAADKSDFIVRKMMDNYYLVLNSDVKYSSEKLNFTGGINLSRYNGHHFGEIVWNEILGDDYDYASRNNKDASNKWYFNRGLKQEVNIIARAEYRTQEWLTAYLDMQYRGIWLDMDGIEDEKDEAGKDIRLDYGRNWNFFNPRAGMTLRWNPWHKAYLSAAFGHREPARSDIKEVIPSMLKGDKTADLKPEKMIDVEIGYEYSTPEVKVSANIYLMEYFDMLLETGRLSKVGYAIKENVGRGWRRGIEMAVGWQALKWLKVDANLTLSLNRIRNYVEYMDAVDVGGNYLPDRIAVKFGTSTMLMSPPVVGMAQLAFTPFRNIAKNSLKTTTLTINGKYVGRQYADNTASKDMAVPGYFTANLSLTHEFSLKHGKLGVGAYIGNLLNKMYYADAACWYKELHLAEGQEGATAVNASEAKIKSIMGVFPQAPLNFMVRINYKF